MRRGAGRMKRVCTEVQGLLPTYVDGALSRVRRPLVALHLRRCGDCQAAFSTQRGLSTALAALSQPVTPPEGLLEELLEQTRSPRGAAPLRGAVSGARPALSVVLLAAGAVAGAGAGWASWASARHLRHRFRP